MDILIEVDKIRKGRRGMDNFIHSVNKANHIKRGETIIFKTKNRRTYSKLIVAIGTSLILSFFMLGVFTFKKFDIGLSILLVSICGIAVSVLYEELHIKENHFDMKCFYYSNKIYFQDIKTIKYTSSKICLYGERDTLLHTFFQDGSEKVKTVIDLLDELEIPKLKVKSLIF